MAGTEIANEAVATCSCTMQTPFIRDKELLPGAPRLSHSHTSAPSLSPWLGEEHCSQGPAGSIPQVGCKMRLLLTWIIQTEKQKKQKKSKKTNPKPNQPNKKKITKKKEKKIKPNQTKIKKQQKHPKPTTKRKKKKNTKAILKNRTKPPKGHIYVLYIQFLFFL